MGWHLYHVPVYEGGEETFYVRHIDLFAHIAVYASWALLAVGALMRIASLVSKRGRKG